MIPAEDAAWAEIRDAAFQVVVLTQRSNGFWKLPTNVRETKETHHDTGSIEDQIRKEQGFGYESVTVSFCALTALFEATQSGMLDFIAESLDVFAKHRDPDGCGYGSPAQSHAGDIYNTLPRHTASAAAAYLLFSRDRESRGFGERIDPTIDWLLRNRLRRGGWPLSLGTTGLGYLTTAAGVMALSLYLARRKLPPGRAALVRLATAKSYAALAAAQESGVWEGDGIKAFQLRYCATALRFLQIARNKGALAEIADPQSPDVREMVKRFCGKAMPGGWPDSPADSRPSTIANLTALDVVLEEGNPAGLSDELLNSAGRSILNEWSDGTLAPRLRAWDWQCLAILAARKAGPIPKVREAELMNVCGTIRSDWKRGALKGSALKPFDKGTGDALTFALSRGRGFGVGRIWSYLKKIGRDLLDGLVVKVVWLVAGGLVMLIILLVFGSGPLDRIRAFLERLGP